MIGARHLECMLVSLPEIREVCVIPSNSPEAPYEYQAFVVLVQNSPSAVYAFHQESAAYLSGLSVKVEILPELPKSPMGRVSREGLIALCKESAA